MLKLIVIFQIFSSYLSQSVTDEALQQQLIAYNQAYQAYLVSKINSANALIQAHQGFVNYVDNLSVQNYLDETDSNYFKILINQLSNQIYYNKTSSYISDEMVIFLNNLSARTQYKNQQAIMRAAMDEAYQINRLINNAVNATLVSQNLYNIINSKLITTLNQTIFAANYTVTKFIQNFTKQSSDEAVHKVLDENFFNLIQNLSSASQKSVQNDESLYYANQIKNLIKNIDANWQKQNLQLSTMNAQVVNQVLANAQQQANQSYALIYAANLINYQKQYLSGYDEFIPQPTFGYGITDEQVLLDVADLLQAYIILNDYLIKSNQADQLVIQNITQFIANLAISNQLDEIQNIKLKSLIEKLNKAAQISSYNNLLLTTADEIVSFLSNIIAQTSDRSKLALLQRAYNQAQAIVTSINIAQNSLKVLTDSIAAENLKLNTISKQIAKIANTYAQNFIQKHSNYNIDEADYNFQNQSFYQQLLHNLQIALNQSVINQKTVHAACDLVVFLTTSVTQNYLAIKQAQTNQNIKALQVYQNIINAQNDAKTLYYLIFVSKAFNNIAQQGISLK